MAAVDRPVDEPRMDVNPEVALVDNTGFPTYSSRENAVKKLERELKMVPAELQPLCLVAVTSDGRYLPVASGPNAVRLGLHFHGVVIV